MRFLLAVLLALAADQAAERRIVLVPGHHWTSMYELPLTGWLALHDDGTSARLTPSPLAIVDTASDPDEVFVDSVPKGAVLLFRGIPQVSAGPVVTAQSQLAGQTLAKPGDVVRLGLGDRIHELTLHADDEQLRNARIEMTAAERKQTLFALDGEGDEPHFEVLWAGDLDRDGLLDLVMTMSGKYSAHPRTLWLSSAAHEGELLREVASWEDFSC